MRCVAGRLRAHQSQQGAGDYLRRRWSERWLGSGDRDRSADPLRQDGLDDGLALQYSSGHHTSLEQGRVVVEALSLLANVQVDGESQTLLQNAIDSLESSYKSLATIPLATAITGLTVVYLSVGYLRQSARAFSPALGLVASIISTAFIGLAFIFTMIVMGNAQSISFDSSGIYSSLETTATIGGAGIALIIALLLSIVAIGLMWHVHKTEVVEIKAVLPIITPRLEPRRDPPPFSVVSVDMVETSSDEKAPM